MVLAGEHERPDFVVFADTGSERPQTIATVERAKLECEAMGIPFEIATPQRGPLHLAYMDKQRLPIVQSRLCTTEFKRTPIHHAIKRHLGVEPSEVLPPGSVVQWIGISTDERHRAKPSPLKWALSRFPLLDLDMSRDDCIEVLNRLEWAGVEKSGCFCCPFQSAKGWVDLRIREPELFEISKAMESLSIAAGKSGFLHNGTLERFDFNRTLEDWGLIVDEPLNQLGRPIPRCENPDGGCFT